MSMPYNAPKPYQPSGEELSPAEIKRLEAETALLKKLAEEKQADIDRKVEEAKSAKLRFKREELSLDRDQLYYADAVLRHERQVRDEKISRVGAGHNGVFFFDKQVRGDYGSANGLYDGADGLTGPGMEELMAVVPESFQPLAGKFAEAFFGKTASTVRPLIAELTVWAENNPEAPLELVINSPGGSVYAGWFLIGALSKLSKAGHHVTTVVSGMAASMGGVIAQVGDTRVIEEQSSIMIHEASSNAWGPAHTIRDTADHLTDIGKQIRDLYVSRSGGKTSTRLFEKHWDRRDWWIRSQEAFDRGFVDEIR